MPKFIILICDGMADRPGKKGKTPLESAKKPNLDSLAAAGVNGIMDTISPGVRPGSDTAHLALLGYDPYKCYTGRGVFEALGAELRLEEGDVAFRANFATVDSKLIIQDRRAGRVKGKLKELEAALNKIKLPVEFKFLHTIDHRGVLMLRGKGKLSAAVSDSDPHEINVKIADVKPLDNSKEAQRTAEILNQFTREAFKALDLLPFNKQRVKKKEFPANAIILRGSGLYKPVQSFESRYGLRGGCIAATALVRGVCSYLGLDVIHVPGATGGEDTDLEQKFKFALRALETRDFVLINVKATDNFGHDGDFDGKVRMIEKIDKKLQVLLNGMKKDTVLAVLSDHATPVSYKNHSGDSVPICISGPGVGKDTVTKFDEYSCAQGYLQRIRGLDLIPLLMNFADKAKLFGA